MVNAQQAQAARGLTSVRAAGVALHPVTLLVGSGLAGLLLAWPARTDAVPAFSAFAGQCLLGGLLLVARYRQQSWRISLACAAVALSIWQLLGMSWLTASIDPGAKAWMPVLQCLLLLLNVAPVLLLWVALCLATRVAGSAPNGLGVLMLWSLAWWAVGGLRQQAWWGGDYGALALALLDLPYAGSVIAAFGGAGLEAVTWLLAGALVWSAWRVVEGQWRKLRNGVLALGAVASCLTLFGRHGHEGQVLPGSLTPPLSVMLVQPSAHPTAWSFETRDAALAQLYGAMRAAPHGAVLVTSESFFNEPPPRAPHGAWADLLDALTERRQHLIVGLPMPVRDASEGEGEVRMMNAALQLSPIGDAGAPAAWRESIYAKQRLAPGGEFLPWPYALAPLYAKLFGGPPRPDLVPAPAALSQPLFVAGYGVGVTICHELAFGAHVQRLAGAAEWLLNMAYDGSIDDAAYRHQVRQIARLRAIESGKPLLRVSQGSGSLFVAADGAVLYQMASTDAQRTLISVTPSRVVTRYQDLAPVLVWLPAAGAAVLLVLLPGFGLLMRRSRRW